MGKGGVDRAGRRELLACALGTAAAVVSGGSRGRIASIGAGPVALWAADRAGHAVYGLDADGIVRARVPVTAPVRLGPGGSWVLSAVDARADGHYQIVRLGADGRRHAPIPAARPAEQDPPPGIPAAGLVRVARPRDANKVWLLRNPSAASSRPLARPTDTALERWVRHRGSSTFRRAFLFELPFSARALTEHRGCVWVASDRACNVWVVRHTGETIIKRFFPDADGVEAIVPASDASGGGAWLAACGSLVRVDRWGRRLPGQGGFAHLVDLAEAQDPLQ